MRKIVSGLLLSLCGTAMAANTVDGAFTESNKVRTFRATLGTAGVPHAVYFNAMDDQLVVCANGEATLCQSWRFKAQDVLPYSPEEGESKLLVIDSPFSLRTCSIGVSAGRPDVKCAPLALTALIGNGSRPGGVASIVLNFGKPNEYQCGFRFKEGILCASAQLLQSRAGSLVFGHFTGDKRLVQALSVDQRKVCNVGGSCRAIEGLELLATADSVAAAGRTTKRIDRAALIGLSEFTQTACMAFYESEERVGFTCEQEVTASAGPASEAFVVHGSGADTRDVVIYAGRGVPLNAAARQLPTAAEAEMHRDAPRRTRDLIRRAFTNAGGPMSLKNFKAGLYTAADDGEGFVKALYYYDDDEGPNNNFGVLYEGRWGASSRGSYWSDSFGYYFQTFLTGEDLYKCLAICDSNKNNGDAWCDTGAGLAFGVIEVPTVVAAVSIVWAGGVGAGALLVAGTQAAGLAYGAAQAVCRTYTGSKRIECQRDCQSRKY